MYSKKSLLNIFLFFMFYILFFMIKDMISIRTLGIFLIFFTILCVFLFIEENNPSHAFWGIAFASFIFYPLFITVVFNVSEVSFYLYMNILFIFIFILLLNKNDVWKPDKIFNTSVYSYIFYCSILSISLIFLPRIAHFFTSTFLLWILISNDKGKKTHYFVLTLVYLTYYAFFINYIWDGYGRLILFAYMFMPFYSYVFNIKMPIMKFSIVANMILMPLMSLVRYGELSVEKMLSDSSVSAFFLLNDIYIKNASNTLFSVDFNGFLQQVSLVFISFIPREIFPHKPLGFGRLYVETELNRYQYSEAHSIAATLFGDPIYYLGNYLWLPAVLLIIYLFNIFYRYLKTFNNNLSVVFLVFIPTLIWGGLASFSSRFLFLFLFLFLLSKLRFRFVN